MPRDRRIYLGLIVLAYLVIAFLYALYTPRWQVPDEPAHYNYIREVAEHGRLPVLRLGDYDQTYLETIKARRFPPDLSIDPIRYESYQPPFYYLLAAPLYRLTGGALLPLRLFSVALGGLLLLLTDAVARAAFPKRPDLALGATAFVAFLPQHVAMMAGVNNDALAEVLIAAMLLLLVKHLQPDGKTREGKELVALGILLGLGLLTKGSAYVLLPLSAIAIFWRWWRVRRGAWRDLVGKAAAVFIPALALGLPLWLRNMALYGLGDFLGKRWHDVVVVNQPRTAEWLAEMGLPALLRAGLATTFRSFWGQFGWMGVLMDERIYLALAVLSLIAVCGLVLALPCALRNRDHAPSVALFALLFVFSLSLYIWYNLTFVQHQGRYLFPALVPVALGFAAGLSGALQPRAARRTALCLLVALLLLVIWDVLTGKGSRWLIAMLAGAAGALWFISFLRPNLRTLAYGLAFVALAFLDLLALFVFIVPQL